MRTIMAASLCAVLAGCVDHPTGMGERGMSLADLSAKDDARCREYGAAPGSGPYVQCRAQLQAAREGQDASRRNAAMTW